MKKYALFGALVLVLAGGVLFAQEAQTKVPDYKLKGGSAEWYIRDVRPDDIWKVLTDSLEAMNWKVMNKTESGLIINVMANLPDETDPMKKPKAFIGVAAQLTNVLVSGHWYVGEAGGKGRTKSPKEEAKKFWDELFGRMAEALK